MADLTVNATGTIANDAVTNAKLANMAAGTIKGRAAGAGTGDPTDLTADQASTILDSATDPFVRTSDLPSGGGDLLAANNLGDLDNAATARTNLGLGTAALSDAVDFADAIHAHVEGDIQGLTAALALKAAIHTVGNTVFVSKDGNDGTGLRERSDKAFLTLTAAKTAAQSGDTIIVHPGTYSELNLLKNGVNWHFMAGAVVDHSGSPGLTDVFIFDDGADGANGAVTCSITGFGVFISSGDDDVGESDYGVLRLSNSGSNVSMEADVLDRTGFADVNVTSTTVKHMEGTLSIKANVIRLSATAGNGQATVLWENGNSYIKANTIEMLVPSTASLACVWAASTGTPTGDMYVEVDELLSNGTCVYSSGANTHAVWIFAKTIRYVYAGSANKALTLLGSKSYITCQKVFGAVRCGQDNSLAGIADAPLVYLTADKLETVASGTSPLMEMKEAKSFVNIKEIKDLGGQTHLITSTTGAGGVSQHLMEVGETIMHSSTTNGINISGGTLRMKSSRINSAANASGNPVLKSGGTLVLEQCALVAEGTRDSISAATAQTVVSYGAYANKAVDADVTIDGNLTVGAYVV